jgi:putative ATP-binding cassette transporter
MAVSPPDRAPAKATTTGSASPAGQKWTIAPKPDNTITALTNQSSFLISTIANVSAIGYLSFFVAILFKDVIQVLFLVAYVYYLSPTQFLLVAIMLVIIGMEYWEAATRIDTRMRAMQESDETFLNVATDLLTGFKEIKMNRDRSEAINAEIRRVSFNSYRDNCSLRATVLKSYGNAELVVFGFLALLIFVEPRFTNTSNAVVVQVAMAVTFIFGVIREAMGTSTEFMILGRITTTLTDLERQIDRMNRDDPIKPPAPWTEPFESLEVRDLVYDNIDVLAKTRFTVGPASMTLHPGEIVFLTGNNGSGKSTLVRVLCGLYGAHSGETLVNGKLLDSDELGRLRSLFAVVFADYHLFQRLYGSTADEAVAERHLIDLGLGGKTELKDGAFTSLRLSSGQRTRVALVIAMLEDRPIYVFDEWAADQDPVFRDRYYYEILPALRDAGKLVIAVTHDEAYFHCCDRRFEVLKGQPHEVEKVN